MSAPRREVEAFMSVVRAERSAAGLPPLTVVDTIRLLMKDVGSVVVGFFPDAPLIPGEGDILDRWGYDLLPKGARLVVGAQTNVNAWTSQVARVWGAELAGRYPRVRGAKFFRCTFVEKAVRA